MGQDLVNKVMNFRVAYTVRGYFTVPRDCQLFNKGCAPWSLFCLVRAFRDTARPERGYGVASSFCSVAVSPVTAAR